MFFSKKDSDLQEQHELVVDEEVSPEHKIILYNDEINTFDHVIDSLVDVCDHNSIQAEQCSLIIHFNGKCDVKHGEYEKLKPMRDALNERGLSATIE